MERPMMSLWESANVITFVIFWLCLWSMLAFFRWHHTQKKRADSDSENVAPAPPAWPILGHLHLMKTNRPFHQTLWSLAQRYGPIMHLQFGCRPVLVVSSSDLAKECFTKYDKIFAFRPTSAAGEHLAYGHKMLGFDPYGPIWRTLKRICTTDLLSPARIETTRHIRTDEVSNMVRSLFHSCTLSQKVNMRWKLQDLTLNIIMRTVTDQECFLNPGEVQQLGDAIMDDSALFGVFNVGDYFPFLRWLDVQGWERAMKRAQRRRDALIQKVVDEHRRGQRESSDFIDVLLSSLDHSDDRDTLVKATALGIITAATGTSAKAIEWGLSAMIQHPEMCKKAQEEVDAKVGRHRVVQESDLPRLEYLGAILKETMRLYPGGPLLIPHMSTEACRVGGYYVPAGTRLLVNVWAIHRDPATWECPLEFEPDRFLKESVDFKEKGFKYMPFGRGRRGCPGALLAMEVVGLSLGRLLQGFDWSVEGVVDMSEGIGLGLERAVPLEAIIKARLPGHLY